MSTPIVLVIPQLDSDNGCSTNHHVVVNYQATEIGINYVLLLNVFFQILF